MALRPGNDGSDTASDHIGVLSQALAPFHQVFFAPRRFRERPAR